MKRYRKNNKTVYVPEEGDLPPSAYTHRLSPGERTREPIRGKIWIEISAAAVEILGQPGRLLSWSKSRYLDRHPDDEVLFNACIFSGRGLMIWFGDLNLTSDGRKLQQMADRVRRPIYVTPERPYRTEGLPSFAKRRWDPRIRCYRPRSAE